MSNYIFDQAYSNIVDYMDQNDSDFSAKTNPDYKRQETKDRIYNKLNATDWEQEAKYFNYTFKDKTLRMNNKKWHKLTSNKYARTI